MTNESLKELYDRLDSIKSKKEEICNLKDIISILGSGYITRIKTCYEEAILPEWLKDPIADICISKLKEKELEFQNIEFE